MSVDPFYSPPAADLDRRSSDSNWFVLAIRRLVVLEWLLFIVVLAVSFFQEDMLPPAARELNDASYAAMPDLMMWGFLCLLAGFFAAGVGLLLLRPWARTLYLIVFVWGYVFGLFDGPYAYSAMEDLVGNLATCVEGAIVVLLISPPGRAIFERPT